MLNNEEFRVQAHEMVDWIADYLAQVEKFPVKSNVAPGDIFEKIPYSPPHESEEMDDIMKDFEKVVLPGITHWQSPRFFAYFPANSSYPSILAEMLTAAIGAQCMVWETSPAAAELEEKMMEWLKALMALPANFHGVIQDTASTATLVAILTAREKATGHQINNKGFSGQVFRVYCSAETHSSVEKAVKIAGLGSENLVKVKTDHLLRMEPNALRKAIEQDIKDKKTPLCVVGTLGTTGTVAIDPLQEIAGICQERKLWFHVDGAYAGSALALPENRDMAKGIEHADSFVFNPHKWLFTNFDCSAYFVKDKEALARTFEIHPEYLKTKSDKKVNNYRDWGIQLGRRFRALKLWFVLRNFGTDGIQETLRRHIELAETMEKKIQDHPNFEMVVPRSLNVLAFRYVPGLNMEEDELNSLNERILHQMNRNGRAYLTHTKVFGKYTLRLVIAQTYVQAKHVEEAWEEIQEVAASVN
jgi:aromatic-L-amino-acid decarboxylase